MRIEKLNDNKIRIILNLEDLQKQNIDFHSFMADSIETQSLFLDMLSKAEQELGFTTKDHRLILEALATSDGNFILTVTKVLEDSENAKTMHRKVLIKRKNVNPDKILSVYVFDTFDNFCEFSTYLNTSNLSSISKKLKNTKLYLYNSKYYLVLHNVSISIKNFKSFHCLITEFASYMQDSILFERKLLEYGKTIMPKNAINTCIKHFS
jgi:adapter protein MecA 1/2